MMRNREKPAHQPGWFHYRALCDYIREAVAKNKVSYQELGLENELDLLELELECVNADIVFGHKTFIEIGLKLAIEGRIRKLNGSDVTPAEKDAMLLFFPQNERVAA